jgi:radical SAM protein with 4Fe4S-binding SPASM domain
MDFNMISASPTFCPAPWTSLNIDQTGQVYPCMHCSQSVGNIKNTTIQEVIHGPVLNSIRDAMAHGKWHSACNWCKQLEDTTGVSGRTQRSASQETINAINADIDWFSLEHIVVNWSNLCNLTCVYCNPEASTAWQHIKGIPINHVKNEHPDLIKLAKEHGHTIRGLMLGGGEPLLQKGLLEFLKYLNPDQIQVLVTTNLSIDIDNNPIYNELRTWPSVQWEVSFDNSDPDKFEYVRNGANWEQFVKNIQLMKQHGQQVTAHPAYSIYCAFDLVEFYEFCIKTELDIYWCELQHPWDLDVRRLSTNIRQQAADEIDRVVANFSQHTRLSIDTLKRYQKTLVDNSYLINPDYQSDPLRFHQQIEVELNKTKTFEQLWPGLVQQLKNNE